LSKSTRTELFKNKYPQRFFNIGIAEQNMMSIAAGLAACGKIVFASTFAMFAAGRAFEQIRNSICYPNLNVKICASHAGITVGEDGASHQCTEDLALICSIPNMIVINPADAIETECAVQACIKHNGPVYIRLSRLSSPVIFESSKYHFQIGKGIMLKDGNDLTIISTGTMLNLSLEATEHLSSRGINARLINMHTLKPIDKDILLSACFDTGAIVTVEEHSVIGGLGSIVASFTSQNRPVPIEMVGIQDRFGKSGKPNDLMQMYGLTVENIINSAQEVVRRKNSK